MSTAHFQASMSGLPIVGPSFVPPKFPTGRQLVSIPVTALDTSKRRLAVLFHAGPVRFRVRLVPEMNTSAVPIQVFSFESRHFGAW